MNPEIRCSTILGDTIYEEEKQASRNKQTELTLKNLSEIIMVRLKDNNKSIIAEIKNTIKTEIELAIKKIKEDLEQETKQLQEENEQRKEDIKLINSKIENLTIQNKSLKQEIIDLKTIIKNSEKQVNCSDNNSKKIVLYGLPEYNKETDCDLYNRLIDLFRELQNVDLTGYIENMRRIGRYGTRNRPLEIELLSKRMAKYVIENNEYFYGTRMSVSEYLDENARKKRQLLRDQMIDARKKGQHAVIKNNQLYIEGKLQNSFEETKQFNKTAIDQSNINKDTYAYTQSQQYINNTQNHSFR